MKINISKLFCFEIPARIRFGIPARIRAILHKIIHPYHDLKWKHNSDEICKGDIICKTCNLAFWCRALELTAEEIKEREESFEKIK